MVRVHFTKIRLIQNRVCLILVELTFILRLILLRSEREPFLSMGDIAIEPPE